MRIEDDLIVTETGNEVISDALPIDASGLESWMVAGIRELKCLIAAKFALWLESCER